MVLSFEQKNDLVNLIDYCKHNDVFIVFSIQAQKTFVGVDEKLPDILGKQFLEKSDLCLSIHKKGVLKKSWYQKIFDWLNKFFSSKKFEAEANVTLTIHKNRFGNDGVVETFLDYEQINKLHESISDR